MSPHLLQIDPGSLHILNVYLNRCSDEGCFSDGTKGYMATLWRFTPISLGCVTFPQTETDAQPQLPGERQILREFGCPWGLTRILLPMGSLRILLPKGSCAKSAAHGVLRDVCCPWGLTRVLLPMGSYATSVAHGVLREFCCPWGLTRILLPMGSYANSASHGVLREFCCP